MSQRVVLSSLLVLGITAASLLFASSRTRSPSPPAATQGAASTDAAAAAAAHAAAGISPSDPSMTVDPAMVAGFEQRIAGLEQRLDSDPDDRETRLELARILYDGHRAADAVPHYRRAIELDPQPPQPYYDLAAAHASMGQWEETAAVLQERLALTPDDAIALYNLGATRANQGRNDEALEWWTEALSASPTANLRAQIQAARARLARP